MSRERKLALVAAVLAALLFHWFHLALTSWFGNNGFWFNYEGMDSPDLSEVFFTNYFLTYTIPAMALLVYALAQTSAPQRAIQILERLSERRWPLALLCALAFLAMLCLRHFVLLDAPVTDDENVYDFIADTLLLGRLKNPPLPSPEYFYNRFVISGSAGWFGMYPIGHPLLLALGSLVGARSLVTPLLSTALLALTYLLGERLYGRKLAWLGTLLLAFSPHFLLTGATKLSQPTCAFFVLLALLAVAEVDLGRRPRLMALGAGICLGLAALTRFLPAFLFMPVVGLFLAWNRRLLPWSRGLAFGLGLSLLGAVLLWVNIQQTGSPFITGYHLARKAGSSLEIFDKKSQHPAVLPLSIGSALMRQNLWQAGFALLSLLAFFAQRTRASALLGAMFAAQLAFRLVSPKSGVMCTGPVYLYESLPWLCLLTASGISEASRWLQQAQLAEGRRWASSFLLAGYIVAALCFWPYQIKSLLLGAQSHRAAYDLVAARSLHQAVVFYECPVIKSWADYLRNPKPDFSEDVIFLRLGGHSLEDTVQFAKTSFPNRQAWYYECPGIEEKPPRLTPLQTAALLKRLGEKP